MRCVDHLLWETTPSAHICPVIMGAETRTWMTAFDEHRAVLAAADQVWPLPLTKTLPLLVRLLALLFFHGWVFSGHSWISEFRFLSESNKNGGEMHFECDFSPFRIQTLTQSLPCCSLVVLSEQYLVPRKKRRSKFVVLHHFSVEYTQLPMDL